MNSAERHEARYQRRRAARLEKRARNTKGLGDFESVFSFEHLYAAYRASVKGVGWKASTQRYKASALANIDKTHNALLNGTFKSKGFYEFDIIERGKPRHIRSVHISERVVQRCLCDYSLVPMLSRSFIYDNGASLQGKGYDFAVRRVTRFLTKHYRQHGREGYALVFDFSKYFDTAQHAPVFRAIEKSGIDDRLVAYRHICPDPNGPLHAYDDTDDQNGFVNEATGEIDPSLISGKTIRVTFDYNNTKNGLAEKLTRGTYVLLVAANYSESDKFGALGIAAEIKSLLDLFDGNSAVGISNFKDNHSDFYNLALEIPEVTENGTTYDPYIRPGDVSIPLCTTQYLHLISGVNRYNAELKRTCARMRIDVCNYSELPLTINSLEFSSNFTQSNC